MYFLYSIRSMSKKQTHTSENFFLQYSRLRLYPRLTFPPGLGCRESKPFNFSSPSSPTRFSGSRRCAPTSSSVQRSACLCFRWRSGIPAAEPELWESMQTRVSPRPALGYVPRKARADMGFLIDVLSSKSKLLLRQNRLQKGITAKVFFPWKRFKRWIKTEGRCHTGIGRRKPNTKSRVLWFWTVLHSCRWSPSTRLWWMWALSAECAETIV